jgi:hypothetical protein
LSADVITILQDDLRLLLRGEIIWQKQRGSSGSCAWGSFQSSANPVLRDLTERVVIASKGRFDRALVPRERERRGLPSEPTMTREDFMEGTLDVWEIPPERASRVGHPAPFPVELPARLIDLYTYRGDLVLDPFLGSGSTAVAAIRTGRHYVGYDLDQSYVDLAESRVAEEQARQLEGIGSPRTLRGIEVRAHIDVEGDEVFDGAVAEGRSAKDIARVLIQSAGFTDIAAGQRIGPGIVIDLVARDRHGDTWLFDVAGGLTSHRPGLERSDALWGALGRAAVVAEIHPGTPLVLLTTALPKPGGNKDALARVCGPGKPILAVIHMLEYGARRSMAEMWTSGCRVEAGSE